MAAEHGHQQHPQRGDGRAGGLARRASRARAGRPPLARIAAEPSGVLLATLWAIFLCRDRRYRQDAVFLACQQRADLCRRSARGHGAVPGDPQGGSRHFRRQRPPQRRRQDGVGAGGRRPRQQRRPDRRYRRGLLPACRLDHAADPAGVAGHRYRDLPPRAAAAASGVRNRPAHHARAHRHPSAAPGNSDRSPAAGVRHQQGARSPRRRLPPAARIHRGCGP